MLTGARLRDNLGQDCRPTWAACEGNALKLTRHTLVWLVGFQNQGSKRYSSWMFMVTIITQKKLSAREDLA